MSGAAALPTDWAVPPPLDRAVSDRNQSIWLYIARMHESFNDPDRALAAYENVLKHNQSNIQAIVSAGVLLMKRDHLQPAMAYLSTAVQIDPTNGDAWCALAYSYIMNDDMEKAYHAYSNALTHLPHHRDPHLWFGIGIVYDRIGRLDDALRAFETVLAISPNFERSDEVYYSIGLIYKEQANYNAAHSYMAKIISINSSPGASAEAWYQIGTLHDLANNTSSATEAYHEALARLPQHTKCLQALAWLFHKNGNSTKAVDFLRRALYVEEGDGTTYYLMGRVDMANQEFRSAYEHYQRAVHLDGKNANFWCSIASLYYQRQQYRDAMDAYSRAVHINPDIAEIWYDLGILYEAYSQFNDAIHSYRRALDLQPHNSRFSQRLTALRNARASGTALARPNERPLTDGPDMSPTTRSGQRPHIKCDVVERYGLLPPPPVVHQPVKQPTAPTKQLSAVPPSRAVTDERHAGTGVPNALNGTTAVTENGMHQPASVPNVSNGILSHPSNGISRRENMPISSHPQRSAPLTANGSRDPDGSRGIGNAQYSSQLPSGPQQSPQMGDFSRNVISPNYGGVGSQRPELRSQQPHSQALPSSEALRNLPQQYTQPMQPNTTAHNVHDIQSNPANNMRDQGYSQRGESKWPTAPDRLQPDSRGFPTPQPESSSGHPAREAAMERDTVGSNMTQSGGLSTLPGNDRPHQTEFGPSSRPIQNSIPTYASTQYPNGSQSLYHEGPQSSPAAYSNRGVETATFPHGKDSDKVAAPVMHPQRHSASDELSRRSVSSSHDKPAAGPTRSSEVVQEASNNIAASPATTMRRQGLSNGEQLDVRNETHTVQRDSSSSRLPVLNALRDSQVGSKGNADKADSPVDEEMLPRLPPLPSNPDEQSRIPGVDPNSRATDGRTQSNSTAALPGDHRRNGSAHHGNSTNGIQPKVGRESGARTHEPTVSVPQDTRHHGIPKNDTGSLSNSFGRKQDNAQGSRSDTQGGLSSPTAKRFSEGMPIGSSRTLSRDHLMNGENGAVPNGGNGSTMSSLPPVVKSPEGRATTAVPATERSPADRSEHVTKTVSPLPSRSREPGRTLPGPLAARHSADHGPIPRPSSGPLGYTDNDNRSRKPTESYSYSGSRDKLEKSPPPPRIAATGIRSSLQLDNRGGLPTLKKPRLHNDRDEQRRDSGAPQSQPNRSNGTPISSLRNPFGSGISASFSKSLSRTGPSGPIGVVSLKTPGVSETTTRTAHSEGLTLRSSADKGEEHSLRDIPRDNISGLGKRNAASYENGNVRTSPPTGYGKFLPKSSVIGPSIEGKMRAPEGAPQPRFSGSMPSYRPGTDGRSFGEGNADLNRPKVHHSTGDSKGANRFSGGDL